MTNSNSNAGQDWVANRGKFFIAWGVPITGLIFAVWLPPVAKTLVWSASLIWMGSACLLNARQCGRTHCRFTGPYFLIMVAPTVLHGFSIFPLGPDGWRWLGIVIGVGGGGIWYLSEKILGKFTPRVS